MPMVQFSKTSESKICPGNICIRKSMTNLVPHYYTKNEYVVWLLVPEDGLAKRPRESARGYNAETVVPIELKLAQRDPAPHITL